MQRSEDFRRISQDDKEYYLVLRRQQLKTDQDQEGDLFCCPKCRYVVKKMKPSTSAPMEVDQPEEEQSSQVLFVASQGGDEASQSSPEFELRIPSIVPSQRHCCIHRGSRIEGRSRLSDRAKMDIWLRAKIFVKGDARVCRTDLGSDGKLTQLAFRDLMSVQTRSTTLLSRGALTNFIMDLTNAASFPHFREYYNHRDVEDNHILDMTGFTKAEFFGVLSHIRREMRQREDRSPDQCLFLYLARLRHDWTYQELKMMFKMQDIDERRIGEYVDAARKALTKRLLPKYLGFAHLERQEFLRHNTQLSRRIFRMPEDSLGIVADGTYVYCQKSSNYEFQKKTYSGQKKTNLLKPMLVVCTDGYIMDCLDPQPGEVSDATIFNRFLAKDPLFLGLIRPGDVFFLDRGFRDSREVVERKLRCRFEMPHFKAMNQAQLTTRQANESRFVTKVSNQILQ